MEFFLLNCQTAAVERLNIRGRINLKNFNSPIYLNLNFKNFTQDYNPLILTSLDDLIKINNEQDNDSKIEKQILKFFNIIFNESSIINVTTLKNIYSNIYNRVYQNPVDANDPNKKHFDKELLELYYETNDSSILLLLFYKIFPVFNTYLNKILRDNFRIPENDLINHTVYPQTIFRFFNPDNIQEYCSNIINFSRLNDNLFDYYFDNININRFLQLNGQLNNQLLDMVFPPPGGLPLSLFGTLEYINNHLAVGVGQPHLINTSTLLYIFGKGNLLKGYLNMKTKTTEQLNLEVFNMFIFVTNIVPYSVYKNILDPNIRDTAATLDKLHEIFFVQDQRPNNWIHHLTLNMFNAYVNYKRDRDVSASFDLVEALFFNVDVPFGPNPGFNIRLTRDTFFNSAIFNNILNICQEIERSINHNQNNDKIEFYEKMRTQWLDLIILCYLKYSLSYRDFDDIILEFHRILNLIDNIPVEYRGVILTLLFGRNDIKLQNIKPNLPIEYLFQQLNTDSNYILFFNDKNV